jgi:hypothetical protein
MSSVSPTGPAITGYIRLEAAAEGDPSRTLPSELRDAMAMLGMQWMTGEFLGDDAGWPVQAILQVESRRITGYQPANATASQNFDGRLPLEVQVEREPVDFGLRAAVAFGQHFESLARAQGAIDADIGALRDAFPIKDPDPKDVLDPDDAIYRGLAKGRVTNGVELYNQLKAGVALPKTSVDLGGSAQTIVNFIDSIFSHPTAVSDTAWDPARLEYHFSVSSKDPATGVALTAPEHTGHSLDWYSFDPAPSPGTSANQPPAQVLTFNFLPQPVTFAGMPAVGWWDFEDAAIDLGRLEADLTDIGKLLLSEFCLIYGGSWHVFSLPVPDGLVRVLTLVVTDNFGISTAVGPASSQAPDLVRQWSAFTIADADARLDYLLLLPTAGHVLEGKPLEEVLFLRDEMSAMAWAVEKQLIGSLDRAVDGYELWRLSGRAVDAPRVGTPDGPQIYYQIANPVADHWIPLVP